MYRHPELYVREVPGRGRGVFCGSALKQGDLVELCPVLVLPKGDFDKIHGSHLHDYYFLWEHEGETALALGYGSLYNHATESNADYEMDFAARTIAIIAQRDIAADEEICIDYTDGVDASTLWFEV